MFSALQTHNCSLHVSQEFAHLYPALDATPLMSRASAPGLILATGTVASSLKGHAALYVSRDAGITWKEVFFLSL